VKTTFTNVPGLILAPNGQPAALEALRNHWYEGTHQSTLRTVICSPLQTPSRDLDRYTRAELNRKARHLYKNSPFIRGLIERLVTLTMGSGFTPVFKSDNVKWNSKAKAWWRRRSRNVSLGARATASQYWRALCRARFLDGECYSVKTEDSTVNFEALLQGIEAERVCGIDSTVPGNGGNVDGFRLNSQGIVTAMKVGKIEIPSGAFVQHFSPTRLGQYRGETILASAINTAHDVDDILTLEKDAVKDASSKRDVIKTSTGTLSAEQFRNIRFGNGELFGLPNPIPNPTNSDQNRSDYYRQVFGGSPVVLEQGDEYTPYEPKRPGSAWQGFMDFLASTTCLSTNLPPSVLLQVNIGGTDVRRDLDIAQRVVDPWQMDVACELDDCLDYLMEAEIVDGDLRNAPEDWRNRDWFFPAKLNVDRAQAEQDRKDVQAGLMSREEYHARWGDSAEDVDAAVIAEAKRRREQIKTAGFKTVEEFLQVLALDPVLFTSKPADPKAQPPKKD
jgi:capsid protein